ncbi:MAG: IS110 family transposase [Candidatus Synoicihabitans palmerolidicus]|nr:IS110 family transposase [Candidatus Synoicihabitans palmerolidicus]
MALPKGMGTVIFEQMEREICDWNRFDTRKQVGSYTGLCPSEDTSDRRRFQGSITKHGNPRLRHMLIECVWFLNTLEPGLPRHREVARPAAGSQGEQEDRRRYRSTVCGGLVANQNGQSHAGPTWISHERITRDEWLKSPSTERNRRF